MNNYLKIFSLFFLSVGIFFSISLFALKIFFQETDNDKLIVLGPENENIIIILNIWHSKSLVIMRIIWELINYAK